jgi:hypothetical protein
MHRWFGAEYVLLLFGSYQHVKRIRTMPNGREFVEMCGYVYFLDNTLTGITYITRKE